MVKPNTPDRSSKKRKAKPRKMSRAMMEALNRAYRKGYRDGRAAEAIGSYHDW